jgi:hypothetical protein
MQQIANFSYMNSNKEYRLSFPCASHFSGSKSWPPTWIAKFTIFKFFYIFHNLRTQAIHTYQKLHFMNRIVELEQFQNCLTFFDTPCIYSVSACNQTIITAYTVHNLCTRIYCDRIKYLVWLGFHKIECSRNLSGTICLK